MRPVFHINRHLISHCYWGSGMLAWPNQALWLKVSHKLRSSESSTGEGSTSTLIVAVLPGVRSSQAVRWRCPQLLIACDSSQSISQHGSWLHQSKWEQSEKLASSETSGRWKSVSYNPILSHIPSLLHICYKQIIRSGPHSEGRDYTWHALPGCGNHGGLS